MKIMFIAGEPSGDKHSSYIIQKLRQIKPDIECSGVGGPAMEAQGFVPLLPFEPFSRMGFLEVVSHLSFFLTAEKIIKHELAQSKPNALVLVDYAGFNIRILKVAHALGIPVIWYITPKVWAWNRKRAAVLGKLCTAIATIFPFENAYFEGYQAKVSFVGNPLVEALTAEDQSFLAKKKSSPDPGSSLRLAIVPGSRTQEIRYMLGPMVEAFQILQHDYPVVQATVSQCPWLSKDLFKPFKDIPGLSFSAQTLNQLFRSNDVALITSGTATLEAGLAGIPHVIAYRISALSYWMFKMVIRIPFIGLPNIVAGRQIAVELMQHDASPEKMYRELRSLIDSSAEFSRARDDLIALRDKLGSKQPSAEVARLILECAKDK
jgi:lipid-A-disaccharide synthase